MQTKFSFFCAAFLAGPALAQCPVADDLERGILFEVGDSDTELFIRLDEHRLRTVYRYGDGTTAQVILAKGVYVLELIDLENGAPVAGTRTTYSYPLAIEDLPEVTPGGAWVTKAAFLDSEGLSSEEQQYSFGALSALTIGTCRYDMIPVTITYPTDASPPDKDHLHYLPELGLAYLARTEYGGSIDTYRYHTIRVAP